MQYQNRTFALSVVTNYLLRGNGLYAAITALLDQDEGDDLLATALGGIRIDSGNDEYPTKTTHFLAALIAELMANAGWTAVQERNRRRVLESATRLQKIVSDNARTGVFAPVQIPAQASQP